MEAGFKLEPSNCELFHTWLTYLGHVISKDGVETDPKKVTTTVNWPHLVTVTDVRSFLAFPNHYCHFIPKYAHIARLLSGLSSRENASKKNKSVDWSNDSGQAFSKLKELCSQTPILAYTDYTKPFKLHTDTCGLGLMVILYQTQEDCTDKVTIYASQTLPKQDRSHSRPQ